MNLRGLGNQRNRSGALDVEFLVSAYPSGSRFSLLAALARRCLSR